MNTRCLTEIVRGYDRRYRACCVCGWNGERHDDQRLAVKTPGPSEEELRGKVTHKYAWIEVSNA